MYGASRLLMTSSYSLFSITITTTCDVVGFGSDAGRASGAPGLLSPHDSCPAARSSATSASDQERCDVIQADDDVPACPQSGLQGARPHTWRDESSRRGLRRAEVRRGRVHARRMRLGRGEVRVLPSSSRRCRHAARRCRTGDRAGSGRRRRGVLEGRRMGHAGRQALAAPPGSAPWERDGYKPAYVFRRFRTIEVSCTEPFGIGRRRPDRPGRPLGRLRRGARLSTTVHAGRRRGLAAPGLRVLSGRLPAQRPPTRSRPARPPGQT